MTIYRLDAIYLLINTTGYPVKKALTFLLYDLQFKFAYINFEPIYFDA
ncbi:hypothetical protein KS4_29480 [Poriferisphaera corsica]|uniref:Uncharacterized protein n=1 Tax=Poriferisphaera corsica TaxID=2528020 RepID=A0A517YXB9_9BACT|nr:hypothetical protein KS4_29480 [Poriferisphaera corsica]